MKRFKCGHAGKGQFCHRCDQGEKLLAKSEEEKDETKKAALYAQGVKLLAVPKKVSAATMMPSDPVPA